MAHSKDVVPRSEAESLLVDESDHARPAEEISRIVEALRKFWIANPWMRFGQIVVNAMPVDKHDPFYMEDREFIAGLTRMTQFHLANPGPGTSTPDEQAHLSPKEPET